MDNPESDSEPVTGSSSNSDRELCETFDRALGAGVGPSLELMLDAVEDVDRARVFEKLLAIEVRHYRSAGVDVTASEYLSRFPRFTTEVDRVVGYHDQEKTRIADRAPAPLPPVPESIDRFKVIRQIGEGGFGRVLLAEDPKLGRKVAIKLLRSGLTRAENILKEARSAAGLEHEGIVTIYDVDTNYHEPFIVQEYVAGESLAVKLNSGQVYSVSESVRMVIRIADALSLAHRNRVFHRDLKPGNILIREDGIPKLIDFGMALHESDRQNHRGEVAGSLRYMAPEQLRGESHRIDDRTDIWSLSVVFYLLLTGRLPFTGSLGGPVADEIQFYEPTPLRQLDPRIPEELERIVLKGLEKRMADRYGVCEDLINDLNLFVDSVQNGTTFGALTFRSGPLSATGAVGTEPTDAGSASGSSVRERVPVVPRGLMSFTQSDADFYPTLLPGPFDRDGLPTSITFWIDSITDRAADVPVGIIYGRSGCGKSSLVRAGILPRLPPDVLPVYADCTDTGTEQRIIEAVDLKCGDSVGDMDILKRFVAIRESSSRRQKRKVLIVLDQFEQWLHGRTNIAEERLTLALRQCDGVNLQVLIVVRDDFWLAVSQFLRAVEVPIIEDQNTMAVELFGPRHAKQVLMRFGIAYGAIPELPEEQTEEHSRFLDVAIEELSDGTQVPCVTLSLFAHMFKGQEWTAFALEQIGGTNVVGVDYLKRIFDGNSGSLLLRRYSTQSRLILEMLLPQHGVDIKGHTRRYEELKAETGLSDKELKELLQLLDAELSLVAVSDVHDEVNAAKHYRLAHDYMVAPIREWSTQANRRTRKGRALLSLREAASRWDEQRIPGLLPSLPDYIRFQALVPKSLRSERETRYLRAWGRRYYVRIAGAVMVLAIALLVGKYFSNQIAFEASMKVNAKSLWQADETEFDRLAEQLQNPAAATWFSSVAESSEDPRERNRAWLMMHQGHEGSLAQHRLQQAVEMIPTCDALEGRKLARLLWEDKAVAIKAIQSTIEPLRGTEAIVPVAAMLVLLGETETAETLIRPGQDPTNRSRLTRLMADWCSTWVGHVRLIGSSKPDLLRSAVADSVAVAWPRIPEVTRVSLRKALLGILESSCKAPTLVSSVTHVLEADYGYVMRPNYREFDLSRDDWFVNPLGRFLRLSPDDEAFRGVFICDREASNRLLFDYLNDPSSPKPETPGYPPLGSMAASAPNTMPARRISPEQIIALCNWLSEREGLEPCFVRDEDAWRMDPTRSGYRIPTLAEFDRAARGVSGTTCDWHCMREADEELFSLYEVIKKLETRGSGVRFRSELPVASALPNSAGYFDTLGNASEWVWTEVNGKGTVRLYGGDASSKSPTEATASAREVLDSAMDKPLSAAGFRLAIKKGNRP
ncbi:MAG: protein kinase [Planctomycetaceae bacterium]